MVNFTSLSLPSTPECTQLCQEASKLLNSKAFFCLYKEEFEGYGQFKVARLTDIFQGLSTYPIKCLVTLKHLLGNLHFRGCVRSFISAHPKWGPQLDLKGGRWVLGWEAQRLPPGPLTLPSCWEGFSPCPMLLNFNSLQCEAAYVSLSSMTNGLQQSYLFDVCICVCTQIHCQVH